MAGHVETGTMAHPKHYSSKQLDHLGLVSGMCDELGIVELRDQWIPQEKEKRIVSLGQGVKAMILNGLGFANRALYLSSLFFRDKPVERLIGEGIEAQPLNDDLLGRALDAIYEYNPNRLSCQISAEVVKNLGLTCRFGPWDSTGFHTDGQYNSHEAPEEGVVHITKGYSRDHRPQLNPVVLQRICERQAGIPLLMPTLNGNNSDKESFRDRVGRFTEPMRVDWGVEYRIADSALYAAETLRTMNRLHWISRVPGTLGLAGEVIDVVAPRLMCDPTQTAFRRLEVEYGGVKQRWVVVFSPPAYQRAYQTVNKPCDKQSAAESKAFAKLGKPEFACQAEARKALATLANPLKITALVGDVNLNATPRYQGKGRPAQGQPPDFYSITFKGQLALRESETVRQLQHNSGFILATNPLNSEVLSDEELIAAYQDQPPVERGFRFLQDPMFMASTLFLKSPKRIMALMMVMTLSRLVYAALERRIRETLKHHNPTFPNQKGQRVTHPTARWVFQFFSGIHVLVLGHMQERVLNLNQHHAALLKLLGERYETLYSEMG